MDSRKSAALAAAMLIAGGAVAETAVASSQRANATTVKVKLMDGMVMTSTARARAGTVMFTVVNKGKMAHNLVVIKTARPGAMLPMKGSAASERGRVAKSRLLKPGQSQMLMARLAKGSYVLICNVPGHYMMGMRSTLRVS